MAARKINRLVKHDAAGAGMAKATIPLDLKNYGKIFPAGRSLCPDHGLVCRITSSTSQWFIYAVAVVFDEHWLIRQTDLAHYSLRQQETRTKPRTTGAG